MITAEGKFRVKRESNSVGVLRNYSNFAGQTKTDFGEVTKGWGAEAIPLGKF